MGHTRGDIDPTDFQAEKKFDGGQMYYNSKLFQVRFQFLSVSDSLSPLDHPFTVNFGFISVSRFR